MDSLFESHACTLSFVGNLLGMVCIYVGVIFSAFGTTRKALIVSWMVLWLATFFYLASTSYLYIRQSDTSPLVVRKMIFWAIFCVICCVFVVVFFFKHRLYLDRDDS